MKFCRYRKSVLTTARVITRDDVQSRNGVIRTLEGSEPLRAGDYLAYDEKGQWCIPKQIMDRDYRRVSAADREGYCRYQPVDIREACCMSKSFVTRDGLVGKRGDYLVRSQGREWPVDHEIFTAVYSEVK